MHTPKNNTHTKKKTLLSQSLYSITPTPHIPQHFFLITHYILYYILSNITLSKLSQKHPKREYTPMSIYISANIPHPSIHYTTTTTPTISSTPYIYMYEKHTYHYIYTNTPTFPHIQLAKGHTLSNPTRHDHTPTNPHTTTLLLPKQTDTSDNKKKENPTHKKREGEESFKTPTDFQGSSETHLTDL